MKDPNFRLEHEPGIGWIRWTRFIQDNDRGDEDSAESPKWTICYIALDPVTMTDPIHSLVFVHEVNL